MNSVKAIGSSLGTLDAAATSPLKTVAKPSGALSKNVALTFN